MPIPTLIPKPKTPQGSRPALEKPRFVKPSEKERLSVKKEKRPKKRPTKLSLRLKYPKIWKNAMVTGIAITASGTHTIIRGLPASRTFITSLSFTVSGETDITMIFGTFGSSGPMDFGGADEPRGMSTGYGDSPIPCGPGGFKISSSGATVKVSGFVVFYQEVEEPPTP